MRTCSLPLPAAAGECGPVSPGSVRRCDSSVSEEMSSWADVLMRRCSPGRGEATRCRLALALYSYICWPCLYTTSSSAVSILLVHLLGWPLPAVLACLYTTAAPVSLHLPLSLCTMCVCSHTRGLLIYTHTSHTSSSHTHTHTHTNTHV